MCNILSTNHRHRTVFARLAREFVSFAGVGVVGTLAQYLVLILLVHTVAADAVIASSLGFFVGAVVNYLLNYKITFRSAKPHARAAPMFISVALVGLIINSNLVYLFASHLGWYYLAAQVIATGVVLGWNFIANRFWTFRGARKDEAEPI